MHGTFTLSMALLTHPRFSLFLQSVSSGSVTNGTASPALPPGSVSSNLANVLFNLANSSVADTLSFTAVINNKMQQVSVVLTGVDAGSLNTTTLSNASLAVLMQLVEAINNGSFALAIPPSTPPFPPSPLPPSLASPSPSSSSSTTTAIAIGVGVGGGILVAIIAAVAFITIRKKWFKSGAIFMDKTLSDSLDKAEDGKSWKATAEHQSEGNGANGRRSSPPVVSGWNASLAEDEEMGATNNNAHSAGARDLSSAKAWGTIKEPSSAPAPAPDISGSLALSAADPFHMATDVPNGGRVKSAGGLKHPSSGGWNRISPEPSSGSLLSPTMNNAPALTIAYNHQFPRSTAAALALDASSPLAKAEGGGGGGIGEGDRMAPAAAAHSDEAVGQHFMLPGGFVSFKAGSADHAAASAIYAAELRGAQPPITVGQEAGEEGDSGRIARRPFGLKLPTLDNAPQYRQGHLAPIAKSPKAP